MVCVNMECKGGDFSMHFRAMDSRSGSLMNWERIVVPLAIQTYWMSSGLVIIDWVFFFKEGNQLAETFLWVGDGIWE